jgi:hypothetical protein
MNHYQILKKDFSSSGGRGVGRERERERVSGSCLLPCPFQVGPCMQQMYRLHCMYRTGLCMYAFVDPAALLYVCVCVCVCVWQTIGERVERREKIIHSLSLVHFIHTHTPTNHIISTPLLFLHRHDNLKKKRRKNLSRERERKRERQRHGLYAIILVSCLSVCMCMCMCMCSPLLTPVLPEHGLRARGR